MQVKLRKISLNASKTEMLIFRHPNKKLNYDLKIKLDGKKYAPLSMLNTWEFSLINI